MKLVDLNLLLYAVNRRSHSHAAAKGWLDRTLSGDEIVALSWSVILGFLRIATSPRVFAHPLSPSRALETIETWRSMPCVRILAPGEAHWEILRRLIDDAGTAGNLTSDAHLAALAIEHHAVLASADADFARFSGLRWENPLQPSA